MAAKKIRQNKLNSFSEPNPESVEECPDEVDHSKKEREMKKKFGAMAFVENIASENEEEIQTLSFDSLREAFAALELEEQELVETIPKQFREEESKFDEYNPEQQPEYEEDFAPEPIESISASLNTKTVESPWKFGASSVSDSLVNEKSVEINPLTIIEAMLFVGDRDNKALNVHRITEKMRNVEPEEVDLIVDKLILKYERLRCPYTIKKESDSYRMVLKPEFSSILTRFYGKIREARLSQQAIDTLAVVAYRQPISADEVQKIRRQPSSTLLSQLVRRELLCIERVVRDNKKVVLYRTTDRFLELFQLESLDDLPISEELDSR